MSSSASIPHYVASRAHRPSVATLVAVALGGILGATARVYLPWPGMLHEQLAVVDPVPTVVVNLLGAALLGLVTGYTQRRHWPEPLVKGVTTGFLGTFTTMSAVAMIAVAWALGEAVFAAGTIRDSILHGTAVVVALIAFLWLTTRLTMGTYRLGSRFARGRS